MTSLAAPPIDPPPEDPAPGSGPPPARVSPTPSPLGGRPSLVHQPALDGLRGLAVAGVLLFHGGVPWAQGGFLGVVHLLPIV